MPNKKKADENNKTTRKQSTRRQNIRSLIISLAAIIIINFSGSHFFERIDLTAEKRYTLTNATRNLLRELDDYVYFRVYLEGDFPAGFTRLRNQTREMLDEFSAYSDYVQFEFINPTKKGDSEATEETYQMLFRKGLQPTQLQVEADDATSQQIIFPGAVVSYGDKEIGVSLLQEQLGSASENVINNSAQALEYNLATAIYKLTLTHKPKIAFSKGNGELQDRYLADIKRELDNFYELDDVIIQGDISALDPFQTLIVAQPMQEFTEQDKFVIDQFIMNGGSVLWAIDPVFASMDSLQMAPETLAMAWPLNLDDMLFNYGARLNTNLVMDMQSVPIPITTGYVGNQPQISMVPWFYFPLAVPASAHPVVKNLNPVRTEFVSTLDTVGDPGIKKTLLLQSSPYSRVLQTPARISFDIMEQQPDESLYREGPQPLGVVLEGKFESVFKNRIVPVTNLPTDFQKRDVSQPAKMIVVADGDILRNQFDRQGEPLPLGFDRFLNETFGNADFVMNAINYLNDDMGIMEARTREIRIRQLDRNRINEDKLLIQFTNIALPVLLVFIFGAVRFYWRKRRFNKKIV
ncbi:MAG: gliding motility-associated ABC transporter substrate-binding protein GldG [Bacteroidales bacterium]